MHAQRTFKARNSFSPHLPEQAARIASGDRPRDGVRRKNLCLVVKFSLQKNESAYKFNREDPKTERFVETGVLLLFQGIA